MAYIDHDKKKQLTARIKYVLKGYGFKGTIAIRNYSTLIVTLSEGRLDLITAVNNGVAAAADFTGRPPVYFNGYCSVNQCQIDSGLLAGDARTFMQELSEAMNDGNDNDATQDYFNEGWFTEINIGRWNKPYKFTGAAVPQEQ